MNLPSFQDLLKRHFWAIGAVTVVTCTFFAGRGAAHILERYTLTDSPTPPPVDPSQRPAQPQAVASRSKAGKPLADRNIFCSTCTPAPTTAEQTPTTAPGGGPIATALPLNLIATFVSDDFRMATILNTDSQFQGGYVLGSTIPGAGPIVAIDYKYVDFKNPAQGNRVERVSLGQTPPPAAAPPPVQPTVATATPPTDETTAMLDAGIHRIDDNNYEVDRSLIDKLLANPLAATKGARVTASILNGQPNGIKLYAIRPESVYAKLGLANGDTIHSINGNALDSLDKGLEVYQKVRDASSLDVSVTRRGKDMNIHYTIK